MSAIEVMSGVAVAGSSLNFSKIKGNEIPITLPTITINTIVNDTTIAISIPPRMKPMRDTASAIVKPIKADTNAYSALIIIFLLFIIIVCSLPYSTTTFLKVKNELFRK